MTLSSSWSESTDFKVQVSRLQDSKKGKWKDLTTCCSNLSYDSVMPWVISDCQANLQRIKVRSDFLLLQGRNWLPNTGWAISNAAHRRWPAAPSILPKTGWATSPTCPTATYAPVSSRLIESDFEAPQKCQENNVTFFVSTTALILTTKPVSIPIKKNYLNSFCWINLITLILLIYDVNLFSIFMISYSL